MNYHELVSLSTQDVNTAIPITNTKVIAEKLNYDHSSITRTIRKHIEDFKEFDEVRFMDLKSNNSKGGRPVKVYLLTENQFILLITYLRNTEQVRIYKKKFVKAFSLTRKELQARTQTRMIAKNIRRELTDSIKDNVSDIGNFKKFAYSNYSKLVYKKVLGKTIKQYKKENNIPGNRSIRDYLTIDELQQVQKLESAIAGFIELHSVIGTDDKKVYEKLKKEMF